MAIVKEAVWNISSLSIRGVQKQLIFKTALAEKLITFLWGILKTPTQYNKSNKIRGDH